jgi:hypothetical protein
MIGAISLLSLYAFIGWKGQTLIVVYYSRTCMEALADITKNVRMSGIWVENRIWRLWNRNSSRNVNQTGCAVGLPAKCCRSSS